MPPENSDRNGGPETAEKGPGGDSEAQPAEGLGDAVEEAADGTGESLGARLGHALYRLLFLPNFCIDEARFLELSPQLQARADAAESAGREDLRNFH